MDRERHDEALLGSLRGGPEGTAPGGLDLLTSDDWEEVARRSVAHGVAPVLYRRWTAVQPGTTVPEDVLEKLRGVYLRAAARNALLYHDLADLLGALRDAGVTAVPLKGAHLAEIVYGDIALRSMLDVDLLVKEEDVSRTEQILCGLGYEWRAGTWDRETYARLHFHFPYKRKDGLALEIHWDLLAPSSRASVDIEQTWTRARPARVAGVDVLVLSPEDLLVYLCLHLCGHDFALGLRALCDVHETTRHYSDEIDWGLIERIADGKGIGTRVFYCLLLTRTMLGAEIPDSLLDRLRPAGFEPRFAEMIQEHILGQASTVGVKAAGALSRVASERGFRRKVVAVGRELFPPVQRLRLIYRLPMRSRKARLYYLVRPFDVIRKRGRDLLHLALGKRDARASLELAEARAAIAKILDLD